MRRMKSNVFKILLLSFTLALASCMPDSLTKFKEDPPSKTETTSTGATVDTVPSLYSPGGVICPSGNGSDTDESGGVNADLIPASVIAVPFVSDSNFLAPPYSSDGTNNPRHEFITIGDASTGISNLAGETTAACEFADADGTVDNVDLATYITWTVSPTLPTGITLDANTGDFTGNMTGFNELAAYTFTATDSRDSSSQSDSVEIASSRRLDLIFENDSISTNDSDDEFYYTQYNGDLYAVTLGTGEAVNFLPNHYIINSRGAEGLINFIDYSNDILYITIQTPATQEFESYFKSGDAVDQLNPGQVPSGTGSFATPGEATISDLYATLLVGADITGAGNDFALHFNEGTGYVSTSSNDGLSQADDELLEWVKCRTYPDISSYGIAFIDGVPSTTSASFTDITTVTNWGSAYNVATTGEAASVLATTNLDRICEFGGSFNTEIDPTNLVVELHSFAGQSATCNVKVQAKDNIAQPHPLAMPASVASNASAQAGSDGTWNSTAEQNFYFHYQYTGTATDLARLIITVDQSSSFDYKSTIADENKISNGRGTVGTITYIDGNKLYVTLDANDAWAFVVGDGVDDTGSFLSSEGVITALEYTFEVGSSGVLNQTVFEPQIALMRAYDRLDINAAGTTITPFGKTEFDEEFLKQIRINGTLTILDTTSNALESRAITAITLTPGAHSITTAAFGANIQSDVNRIAYVTPLDSSANEASYIDYTIDNYIGVITGGCGVGNCSATDLVLKGSVTVPEIAFVVSGSSSGNIVIENEISTSLSSTPFTITATSPEGDTVTTNFTFSVNSPPANLAMNRNMLINVPSGSAFKIGSYVSSNDATDPGLGIVKDIFPSNENGYQYLDVQLIKGSFSEFDDIDNRPKFDSQETYILGDGVLLYNAAVEMANALIASEFGDSFKSGCSGNPKLNRFIDGNLDGDTGNLNYDDVDATATDVRGLVVYRWDNGSGASTLRPTATNRIYLQVERGNITTGDTIRAANCTTAGAFDQGAETVQQVIADHLILTHGATAGTNFVAGLNITSNNGANRGAGVVHSINGNTSTYAGQYYFDADALFLTAANVDNVNPYVGAEATITAVAQDHTFYLYRYEEVAINFNLGIGLDSSGIPDDTIVQFLEYDGNGYCTPGVATCGTGNADCSSHATRTACEGDASYTGQLDEIQWVATESATPPVGMTFDSNTGEISGTPAVNADKQKYIIRVTNPYGSVEHEFELKVYDHFLARPANETDATPLSKPDSYIMHQLGYGMASVPCRVTQEAMDAATSGHPDAADVVDITCLMDGGESDLFYNGLDVTIKTGDDMCTVVRHTPFYYYDWPYIQTSDTRFQNTGDYADALCGSQFEYNTAAVVAGSYPFNGGGPPGTNATAVAPADLCLSANGGGDFSDRTPAGPSCDDGSVNVNTVAFTATQFECRNSDGTPTSHTDFDQCYDNNGICTDQGGLCAGCPTANDCSTCSTRALCQAAEPGGWGFTGSHNDPNAAATANCTADEGPCTSNAGANTPAYGCAVGAATAIAPVDCGGTQGECIGGVGSYNQGLDSSALAARFIVATNMSGSVETTYNYDAPFDLGFSDNVAISNFMRSNACTTAGSFDFSWTTAGANNDWLDYASESPSGANHPYAGGYNHYEYSCDGGSGTIARVRMFVREWDNVFDVTSNIEQIDLGAPDNLMDDPGDTNCGVFTPCNNRSDWDDFYTSNTACGNTDLLFNFGGGFQTGFPKQKEF